MMPAPSSAGLTRRAVPALLVCLAVALASALSAFAGGDPDATVPEAGVEAFARLLDAASPPLLYDVRTRLEFDVSHIAHAEWLDPETAREAVVARIVPAARGRTVALYCTIGARSVELAEAVIDDLRDGGVKDVVVLSGGIIAWHNARRPLVDARGATEFLHPRDGELRKHMSRPGLARFSPRP